MVKDLLKDRDSAFAHFPIIMFDRMEPFLPSRVGYSIFKGPSDSRVDYKRKLGTDDAISFDLPNLKSVIEYGIWWDWDIEHLYELEAIWIYLDNSDRHLRVEASCHGGFKRMEVEGRIPCREGRPLLYSQPGKHAFAPIPEWFDREHAIPPCLKNAGSRGVHITPLFDGRIEKTTGDDAIVAEYLRRKAFMPSFEFVKEWRLPKYALVPWENMETWIPKRVREILRRLRVGELA